MMIERIAQVLAARNLADWRGYTSDAEAVLKEMLDATPGMIEAAVDNVGPIGCCNIDYSDARAIFREMIQQALAEGVGR